MSNQEYDKFNPYGNFQITLMEFNPNYYEIWSNGQLVKTNKTEIEIKIKGDSINTLVEIKRSDLNDYILDNLIFDKSFSGTDRLYLATIAEQSNISNSRSFLGFKNFIPIDFNICTRKYKEYGLNEPFACSLFFKKGVLAKVSFAFGGVSKLIEFYL